MNGRLVERGPCRFDPKAPTYDTLDVTRFCQPGANTLAVLVHHFHDGADRTDSVSLSGRIMRHAPGLCARQERVAALGRKRPLHTDDRAPPLSRL